MGMLETSGAISRTLCGLVLLIPTPKSPNGSKISNTVLPPTYHPATQPKNRKSTLEVTYAVSCSTSNACISLLPWCPLSAPAGFRPSVALHPHEFGQRQCQPPFDIALRSLASKENWAPIGADKHAKSAGDPTGIL